MNPLAELLRALGLRAVSAQLDDLISLATKKRWGPTEILEHIAALESQERSRRSLERRLSRAKIGRFKPMTDYDWSWPKRIDRDAIESALRRSASMSSARRAGARLSACPTLRAASVR